MLQTNKGLTLYKKKFKQSNKFSSHYVGKLIESVLYCLNIYGASKSYMLEGARNPTS